MAIKIKVDLGGRGVSTTTWNDEMAKKKLVQYLFFEYLDESSYEGVEFNNIERFNRIYNAKKVVKQSKALKSFTETEYKSIFSSAISSIENESLDKIIKDYDLKLKEDFLSFIDSEKGKEVIQEEINTLNSKALARIYEDEESMKSSEVQKDRGLDEQEANSYFKKIIEEKVITKKNKVVKQYTIDGIGKFGDTDNVKLKKLRELGFKDIGLVKKQNKSGLLSDDTERLSLKEGVVRDIYGDASYKFQKVPFGNEKTGSELGTVSDALMIKFGYEWEQAEEKKEDPNNAVARYEQLQKPFKKLKMIIDKYRKILMREVKETLEDIPEEEETLDEVKDLYNEYAKGNKELGEEYVITLDGKPQSISGAIGELFLAVNPKLGELVYKKHSQILKLIEMIGSLKSYNFISNDTTPSDYKVDLIRIKQSDGKKVGVSQIQEEIKKIQKSKTVYAKKQIEKLEKAKPLFSELTDEEKEEALKEFGSEEAYEEEYAEEREIKERAKTSRTTMADKKIQKKAQAMFEDEKAILEYFKNQLTDLDAVYFIKITIVNVQKDGKSKGYDIKSNNTDGKSEMIKKKIVFGRSRAKDIVEIKREDKTNYKEIQKASNLVNTLKRRLNILKNIGSA